MKVFSISEPQAGVTGLRVAFVCWSCVVVYGEIVKISVRFTPVPPWRPQGLLTCHLQRESSALIVIKISHRAAAIWLCFSFCGVAETPAVHVFVI